MPCEKADLPGGSYAIICSRGGSAKRCTYCGARASQLCDFPVLKPATLRKPAHKGTCDAPLCVRCTWKIAGDGDLCRAHAPLWDELLGKPKVGPGATA
jgi:hypothetical protein